MPIVGAVVTLVVYLVFAAIFGSKESSGKAPPMKHRIRR